MLRVAASPQPARETQTCVLPGLRAPAGQCEGGQVVLRQDLEAAHAGSGLGSGQTAGAEAVKVGRRAVSLLCNTKRHAVHRILISGLRVLRQRAPATRGTMDADARRALLASIIYFATLLGQWI